MSKPFLLPEDAALESDLIETMLAGLKEWRSDLKYPESHSDLQGCVRAVLRMFEVKRRPLAVPLRVLCHECEGLGRLIARGASDGGRSLTTCVKCGGKKWIAG